MGKEADMRMNIDLNRHSQNHPKKHWSDPGIHCLTFRAIYESISHRDDFNEPQLFYLSRLVARKLKAFDPRLNADDLEAKPYQSQAVRKEDPIGNNNF